VPGWLHAVVSRGLARAPERRGPTMTALLTELERDRRTTSCWWERRTCRTRRSARAVVDRRADGGAGAARGAGRWIGVAVIWVCSGAMGNWCTLTHLFACARPGDARAVLGRLRGGAASHRWHDPERWALRAGLLAANVVQAESVCKYGAELGVADAALREVRDARVVQICVGEGVMVGPAAGPGFCLGWNYVVSSAEHDLPAVAAMLGGGASVVEGGARRLLCLPEVAPLRLFGGRLAELVERDDPLGRLLFALAAADRGCAGRTSRHLLGLYTRAHGYVHMATLVLHLPGPRWEHSGEVSLEDGAGHNPVHYEFSLGPYARSIYIEDAAAVRVAAGWPIGER